MNDVTQAGDLALRVTDNALRKARELLGARAPSGPEPEPPVALRVYVEGGGCSGFQYGFDLEYELDEDDQRLDFEGVTVVVDPMSYQYLMGAEVDYKEDLMGAQFVVKNPNATTTCGCGMSFSV